VTLRDRFSVVLERTVTELNGPSTSAYPECSFFRVPDQYSACVMQVGYQLRVAPEIIRTDEEQAELTKRVGSKPSSVKFV
jgi:hypothetical protein